MTETDYFHLRLGTLSRSRKRKASDEQKEVDVLLAVDMVAASFRPTEKEIVLVTGDLDFRPAVEEVVKQGTLVTLWYHKDSIASDLLQAVDVRRELSLGVFLGVSDYDFQQAHPWPQIIEDPEYFTKNSIAGVLNKQGKLNNLQIELRAHTQKSKSSILILRPRDNRSTFRAYIFDTDRETAVLADIEHQLALKFNWNRF